ncbi:MAG TPA: TetR/AcrR family transcriptional regulator [Kofleriaceae bacterium]|nr:TetR/AcrR family transcriptional regulator [Kofleriaceae bacterium]
MSTADRIERERQAKRALILEAARELFLERGYEAVTLREIAQRIEHSTTAVYVHFKDKRDLMEQMVAEDFAVFAAALQTAAEVKPARARLGKLGVAYVEFALRLPRHYQLLFLTPQPADARRNPVDRGTPGIDGFDLLVATVEEAMADGVFRPELRDARAIAQAIWAAVHGLVSLFIILGDVPHFEWRSPETLLEVLMGSLMRGLSADGAGLPPLPRSAPAASPPAASPPKANRQTSRGRGTRTAR